MTPSQNQEDREATLLAIVEASPVPMAVNSSGLNIVYVNSAFTRTFSYTLQDIPTLEDWWTKAYPEVHYREQIKEVWQSHTVTSLSTGKPFEPVGAIIHTGRGSTRTAMVSAAPLGQSFPDLHLVVLFDLSDQIAATNALADAHRLLMTVIECIPVRVFWKDRQSRYLGCNTLFANDGGKSMPLELTGKDDFSMTWKDQAELYRADDQAVMDSGIPRIGFEEPQTTPEGNTIWLKTSKVPLRNSSNKVIGLLGIYDDITAEKVNTEALRQAEERYRLLFDLSPVPIGVFDTESFEFLAFNAAGLALYGYTEAEARKLSALDLYFPEDRETFKQYLAEEMQHPEVISNVILRNRRKDGSAIMVEARAHVIDYQGHHARIVQVHDITHRLQIEQELRDTEAHYRLLFDANPVPLGIYDPNTLTLLAVNDAAVDQYGYSRDELLTMGVQQLFSPEELPRMKQFVAEEIHNTTSAHSSTWKNRRKNGSTFWVQLTGHSLQYMGKAARMVLAQDISEIKISEMRERARGQVLELLSTGAGLHQILETIVKSIELENPAMLCSILLLDEAGERLQTGAAPSLPDFYNQAVHGLKIGLGVGSCGTATFTGKRVIVEDIQTHPYWAPYKELAAKAGVGACWSNPIISAQGKVIGSFAIYHSEKNTPTAADIELIEHTSLLASFAIERSIAGEALQLASMVYQNSGEAMVVTDDNNLIIAINPAFTKLTGYTLEEVLGKDPKILASGRQDATFYEAMWHAIATTGQWQGEVWNKRKNGNEYAEWLIINTIYGDNGKVHRRVALFSDITDRKHAEVLIWNQANYDALTQLPNRRLFSDRLTQEVKKAHRDHQHLGLLFLDLDRFKEVNDTLGHQMGDQLLIQAAQRIQDCVRLSDSVARLGGDEFTVILPNLANVADIGQVAQNIIDALDTPFILGEDRAYISASIGITVYPEDADSVEDMLKNADQAMYAAKRDGRNRYSYFTPSMQASANLRMELVRDIHQAYASHEFEVYYQPIVELATGRIHKAEALLRWQHPKKGFISPSVFIPIAEDTGLINDIGNWVFAESVQQVKHLRDHYDKEFQISINKSPVQFRNDDPVHEVWIERLRQNNLDGNSIVIEITEGLLLHADDSIYHKLLMFRDAGIQVAIDDFGTGYSSLSYLKKFDIDYLKIDQSFVRNLGVDQSDLALSEAIVVMAHKLGMKVIAEGVETEQQRDILISIGCDFAQGYLYSKPVPKEQFETLLKQSQ